MQGALDRIRDISRNAMAAAGRVRHFIDTLLDTTRHIGGFGFLLRSITDLVYFMSKGHL